MTPAPHPGGARPVADVTGRARALWEILAGVPVTFSPEVSVAVSPGSRLCPPGWTGFVTIGDGGIATVPVPGLREPVRRALRGHPPAGLPDVSGLRAVLPVRDVLGPAQLAYLDEAGFRPWPGTRAVARLSPNDTGLRRLLAGSDEADARESGVGEITSPAFAISEGGDVVSVCGYRRWPTGVAQLCVLTAAAARGRGLARTVASAAVAHALSEGRLPQWRARLPQSRRVAAALGFRELGTQLSLHLQPGP